MPTLPPFTGLLLDFDGTLGNTEPLHQMAMKKFFAEKGYENIVNESGKSTLDIIREWGEREGMPEEAEQYLAEYLAFLPIFFTENIEHAAWQPDAEDLLERTQHLPRALVTGGFRVWLESFDPKLKIFKHFEHWVTKDDLLPDNEKPKPYAYELGAKKLDLAPNECIAIEDSATGIHSAKSAGCFVVAVHRDSDKDFDLADMVISSLEELSF